jgi:hypothetical protein
MVQSQAANMPTWKANIQNGLPAVRFDGVSSYMTNDEPFSSAAQPSLSPVQPMTIVMVFRDNSANGTQVFLDSFPLGGNSELERYSGPFTIYAGAGQSAGAGAPADSQWHIWMNLFNGGSSKYKIDSGPLTSYPSNPGGGQPISRFVLGLYPNSSTYFAGMDVGEVICLTGDQTANAAAIFNYLDARWKVY